MIGVVLGCLGVCKGGIESFKTNQGLRFGFFLGSAMVDKTSNEGAAMNLIHIWRVFFNAFKPLPQAYSTIIYPTRGQAIVIRDDLHIRHERPWYQVGETFRAAFYELDLELSNPTIIEPWITTDSLADISDFESPMLSGSEIGLLIMS